MKKMIMIMYNNIFLNSVIAWYTDINVLDWSYSDVKKWYLNWISNTFQWIFSHVGLLWVVISVIKLIKQNCLNIVSALFHPSASCYKTWDASCNAIQIIQNIPFFKVWKDFYKVKVKYYAPSLWTFCIINIIQHDQYH